MKTSTFAMMTLMAAAYGLNSGHADTRDLPQCAPSQKPQSPGAAAEKMAAAAAKRARKAAKRRPR